MFVLDNCGASLGVDPGPGRQVPQNMERGTPNIDVPLRENLCLLRAFEHTTLCYNGIIAFSFESDNPVILN